MADDAFDQAFARHLRHSGLVTPEQLAQAADEQARARLPLPDTLVRLGLLTPAQQETLVRKVREQQDGLQQVGAFRFAKKLGQGGMGAVYLAHDPDGTAVAVKVLSRQQAAQPEARQRFRREIEAALKLRHPHIVSALQSGEDDGHLYYVMEYVEGETLDALLTRQAPLPLDQVLNILLQAARGLAYAHRQGILHRDVKPANILLTRDGVAKLLDLGLSKTLDGVGASLQTVTGSIMGTPHYLSPEQARGDKTIDARSDLYSLGATLYHLLTGKVPFEGTTALEILSKHVHQRLPDPREFRPEIPEGVIHVLRRLMAKDPGHRYRDASALIADLEEVAAGRPPHSERIAAELTTLAQRRIDIPRASARRGIRVAVGLAVAAAVALLLSWKRTPEVAPPSATTWADAIDLLARIDLRRDVRLGAWRREGDALLVDETENAGCQVPYFPPAEYDVRLEFTREGGRCETGLFLVREGRAFLVGLAGFAGTVSGISNIQGLAYIENPTRRPGPLADGHRYLVEVRVRRDAVRVYVDDKEWFHWTPQMGDLGMLDNSSAPVSRLLGLSNCETRTTFHRFAVLERSGPGRWGRFLATPEDAAFLAEVRSLPATEQIQRVFDRLNASNPGFDRTRAAFVIEGKEVTELSLAAVAAGDLWPIKGLPALRKLETPRGSGAIFEDLGFLKELPLKELILRGSPVADLSPLRTLSLESLDLEGSAATDLDALKGLPLKSLRIRGTNVKDLSPLKGMALTALDSDLVPPPGLLPSLQTLNGRPAR